MAASTFCKQPLAVPIKCVSKLTGCSESALARARGPGFVRVEHGGYPYKSWYFIIWGKDTDVVDARSWSEKGGIGIQPLVALGNALCEPGVLDTLRLAVSDDADERSLRSVRRLSVFETASADQLAILVIDTGTATTRLCDQGGGRRRQLLLLARMALG